ncbi:MAG: hypothetical protein IT360_23675, partial [Gemmatimonadaceae bacterium]|nr:hypothetical protein [Gemmatimonadaceae bacterium]
TFSRFLGEAATANTVLTLSGARRGIGASVPPWTLPLVLTLVTLGAILVLARGRSGPPLARGLTAMRSATRSATRSAPRIAPRTAALSGDGAATPIRQWTPAPPIVAPVAPDVHAGNGDSRDGQETLSTPSDAALRVAYRLAAVDALLEGTPWQPDAVRGGLSAYRARLKDELVDVLAREVVGR